MSTQEIQTAFASLRIDDNKDDAQPLKTHLKILADASRADEKVRLQLAEPKILTTLTNIVETHLSTDIETTQAALRCIGNASIDNSHARDILAGKPWTWAIHSLQSKEVSVQKLALKVVYNACAEHEEAQKQCFREHVHYELLNLHSNSELVLDDDETGLFVELLFWITGHKLELEAELLSNLPDSVLRNLVALPHGYTKADSSVDDFATAIETCLLFFRDAAVQTQVIDLKLVEKVGQVFLDIEHWLRTLQSEDSEESKDDIELILPLSTSMLWCLSDVSANLIFFSKYDLQDPWIQALLDCISHLNPDDSLAADRNRAWPLETLPHGHRIATAACQVIGNLFWASPAETWQDLISEKSLHHALFSAILATTSPELLHAANGLLIQISRPSVQIREMIGADGLAPAAVAHLCQHDKAEMRQDGMKLLGALGRDCPANQAKFGSFAREIIRNSPPPPTAASPVK